MILPPDLCNAGTYSLNLPNVHVLHWNTPSEVEEEEIAGESRVARASDNEWVSASK